MKLSQTSDLEIFDFFNKKISTHLTGTFMIAAVSKTTWQPNRYMNFLLILGDLSNFTSQITCNNFFLFWLKRSIFKLQIKNIFRLTERLTVKGKAELLVKYKDEAYGWSRKPSNGLRELARAQRIDAL